MPLGVPWSKRTRIIQSSCASRNRRRVEAAGGKFEHRLNLLPRHMKLLDNFLDARTRLKIFKNRSDGHPGIAKHPCAAASVRHAFDCGTLGPIEIRHVLTPPFIVMPYLESTGTKHTAIIACIERIRAVEPRVNNCSYFYAWW